MKKFLLFIFLFFFSTSLIYASPCLVISGDGTHIGDEIACGTEHFYVLSNDGENIKMLSKYNLMAGATYTRIEFDEVYTEYGDIYQNKSLQEKLKEGYRVYYSLGKYDEEKEMYIYYGALVYDEYDALDTKYVFFEKEQDIKTSLKNEEVNDYLEDGYEYSLITLSSGGIIGVELQEIKENKYKIVITDDNYATIDELFLDESIQKSGDNYSLSRTLQNEEGKYIGILLYQNVNYQFETVFFDSAYADVKTALKSSDSVSVLNEGYRYGHRINGNNGIAGMVYYKEYDATYKTVFIDLKEEYGSSVVGTGLSTLLRNQKVEKILDEGYYLTETYYDYIALKSDPYYYYYYGAVLKKDDNYDLKNIVWSSERISYSDLESYLSSIDEYNNLVEDGYEIYEYYSTSSTIKTRYVGVVMGKCKISSCDEVEEETIEDIFQSEEAIGAHGDEHGNPEPTEVGILLSYDIRGTGGDVYSSGYRDYEYYTYEDAYKYLERYYYTLKSMGIDVISVNSPTVSEVNEIVYKASGNDIPLEEW